uniref:Ethylene-overproduction protein 1 n=1 Tax=Anthurium amnicola TaxID=1678845 RepID=A0A1D1Y4Q1_9ARAE
MQNHILNSIRSLNLADGCKGGSSQVYAFNPSSAGHDKAQHHHHRHHHDRRQNPSQDSGQHLRCASSNLRARSIQSPAVSPDGLLPYGLPSPDLIDPPIEPFVRAVDPISALASSFRRLAAAGSPHERCALHLEQRSLLRALNDPKLLRRSLRCARLHAPDVHHKVVLSAWLRFERREDELEAYPPRVPSPSAACGGPALECPKAALVPGYDPDFDVSTLWPCSRAADPAAECSTSGSTGTSMAGWQEQKEDEEGGEGEDGDVVFCIGDEEVVCFRYQIAALSKPLGTMMYGGFMESRREKINFTHNGISAEGMRAVGVFSRMASLGDFPPDIVLELLSFANKFCCEGLKSACDARLASLVQGEEDALLLVDYGLEETAHLLVGSCLQVFLRELPRSLHNPKVTRLLCFAESRQRLVSAGHGSFALYYFLSQVAMEENMRSNTTVMLLERLGECAASEWQKQLAFHQLGCVMLERDEYEDAQSWFEEAAKAGHVYSLAGVARAKYKRGNRYSAFKQLNSLVIENDHVGWMHQERSLYCSSMEEKMRDLNDATRLDPTLLYPYKYRAIILMEDNKIGAAIAEINKILCFKVSTDCLELRAWFSIALEDYEGALRDIRALITLDPGYMMFHGKVHGDQLVEVLRRHVQQWSLADCWMQLYDRWSSVDDIGSLAVVHQMLANDPSKSILWFRQSLLLLRLNCQKAAMRSLRLARNHSAHEHERLVYEGWILYDTGYREEALAKAEESISIQRSFEAFFLKAYALADTSLDITSSSYVIHLLEEALRCPSDGLRKGQALNNLGSVYVDFDKLDLAADCYVNALNIKHTRAHQGLARVYYLKNQRKAAYDEMAKLIEKAQNNASAYEKRSEYCDRDMAKSDLSRTTELDPLRTYPYRYRAAVLMDDHKEDEAIAELTKAIAFKPDLQLLHLRAAFYESMGKMDNTLRDCEAALCLDPNHGDTIVLYNKVREGADQEK